MADGGFRPAFNAPYAADPTSGAVAGMSVDDVGSDMVAIWRARMSTEDASAIYEQRVVTVEHVNAQARSSGLTRFILRGTAEDRGPLAWTGR